jgi:endothelin-converting enzyme/putative endopeptidase
MRSVFDHVLTAAFDAPQFWTFRSTLLNVRVCIIAIAIVLGLAGCGEPPAPDTRIAEDAEPVSGAESGGAEIGAWGIDLSAMDKDVLPGEDFNRYVNGHWLDTFEMPADKARFGVFIALQERSTEQVHEIVSEVAAADTAEGSLEQKVGDYFATWMDLDALNALGSEPLAPHLEDIAAIEDLDALMVAMADLHATAPFGVGVIPDPADTTRYALYLGQAGLGMPDRDYYLLEDDRFATFRIAYRDYIIKLLELAGIQDAETRADAIIALETRIAESHWTRAESRDIEKIYNPMTVAELEGIAPEFAWEQMLAGLGLAGVEPIVVAQPSAMTAAGELLENVPLDTWKDYLAFHFIRENATFLSEDFDRANFEFYRKTLNGIEEQRERWKRGADLVNANLGEAVGKIYVDRHFPPEAKAQMDELVANLRAAFEERLAASAWMDDETRAAALVKLGTFEPRIGFTGKWTDYGPLEIVAGDMLGNTLRVAEFLWEEDVKRLGGPVDREIWPYPPQTVNASYSPLLNQITFPAGILQPPFFDPEADPAVNYGAIGGVIGHEIGHGFDDQGRRFDEKGRIRDWWTSTADERFKERSSRLVAQYDGYSPIEGMTVNGELTLGENIGDLGGVEMAYAAYQRHVAAHGEPPVLDGFTGDQRFFMAWAQVWRGMIRDDALRQRLVTAPHSPAQYRVNGVVRNVDAWYEAFDVEPGAALYLPPEERVSIW